jgi:hypothetical protein
MAAYLNLLVGKASSASGWALPLLALSCSVAFPFRTRGSLSKHSSWLGLCSGSPWGPCIQNTNANLQPILKTTLPVSHPSSITLACSSNLLGGYSSGPWHILSPQLRGCTPSPCPSSTCLSNSFLYPHHMAAVCVFSRAPQEP